METNLLVRMFVLRGTEPGGRRSVHMRTLKKGGRKGIVSKAGRRENERTAFVFSFCGERTGEGHGVVHRGAKGVCTEGGETDASACRGGDADSVGHLKPGGGLRVAAQPTKWEVSGAGKGKGGIYLLCCCLRARCAGAGHASCAEGGGGYLKRRGCVSYSCQLGKSCSR